MLSSSCFYAGRNVIVSKIVVTISVYLRTLSLFLSIMCEIMHRHSFPNFFFSSLCSIVNLTFVAHAYMILWVSLLFVVAD